MVVVLPGNPFQTGERRLPPEAERALLARYHMDDNWTFFWEYLGGALRLDFGPTFTYNEWTCSQIIGKTLPVSAMLGAAAICLALLIGVPLGVCSAVRRGGAVDAAAAALAMIGISAPTFVAGSFLLVIFAVYWRAFPVGGWGTVAHLPLPALALSLPFVAYVARLTRVAMIDVLSSDFVRTAVAKGASRSVIVWRHAFPVAFLPVLSFLGPATAQAMTGSFVVEKVFGIPGLGQHFVNAALNRDIGLILAMVMVFSGLIIGLNIVVDALYAWLDPRVAGAV
jgi:oligopeptide transport system permease protein